MNLPRIRNSKDIPDIVGVRITRREKSRLISLAREQSLEELVQFRYVVSPECITDQENQTLIHLEQLDDQGAVMQATNAVNRYYFHTLGHPSHRSDDFWTNFEHFGAYTRNNPLYKL